MTEVYSHERLGNYLLIYLSPDDLFTHHLTQFSDRQLAWLQTVLEANQVRSHTDLLPCTALGDTASIQRASEHA